MQLSLLTYRTPREDVRGAIAREACPRFRDAWSARWRPTYLSGATKGRIARECTCEYHKQNRRNGA